MEEVKAGTNSYKCDLEREIAAVSNWKLSFGPVMVIPDTSAVSYLSVRQPYALAESDGDSALSQANPRHRVCAPQIRLLCGSTF